MPLLIAKNRKRRLALHTALSTGYQRRQLLPQVACLTVLLLANNNGAAVLSRSGRPFQRNVGWFTNLWTTYSEKRFKETSRISRSTFKFLLGRIRNAIEKDTVTEEPISPEARLAICLYRLARHSRKRNCLCTAHARQGGEDSVWQIGESVFFWRLRRPSHLNQLFCNLHDLWIEFSACLERRLVKHRTGTVQEPIYALLHCRIIRLSKSNLCWRRTN